MTIGAGVVGAGVLAGATVLAGPVVVASIPAAAVTAAAGAVGGPIAAGVVAGGTGIATGAAATGVAVGAATAAGSTAAGGISGAMMAAGTAGSALGPVGTLAFCFDPHTLIDIGGHQKIKACEIKSGDMVKCRVRTYYGVLPEFYQILPNFTFIFIKMDEKCTVDTCSSYLSYSLRYCFWKDCYDKSIVSSYC